MKPIKALVACMLMLVLLTGCWDAIEIEDQFLVWLMGWDVAKEDPNKLLLSLSSPTTVTEVKEPYAKVAATGYSVEEARNNTQRFIFREIELGHMRVLAVGKEFAEKGILKHLDALGRNPKIGRETLIVIIDGRAEELFELKNPSIPRPGEYLVELIRRNARMNNAMSSTFRDFFECISQEGREPATAYVKMDENKLIINSSGIAVFRGDRMVGSLSGNEVQAFLLIRDLAQSGKVTIGKSTEKEGQSTTFLYHRHSTSVKTKVINNIPHVYVTITLEGDIIEFTAPTTLNNHQSIRDTEKSFEKALIGQLTKTVKKCQDEYKSDVFGFGGYFRALHPSYWNSVKWEDEFPDMMLHMTVDVQIRRLGIES